MRILLALPLLILLAGCAGTSAFDPVGGQVSHEVSTQAIPPRVLLAEAADFSIADLPTVAAQSPPLGGYAEELFDPFAKADEEGEEYDPWEPFNTSIFEFNRKLDKYALKPVAQGYDFIIPDFVQVGISNMFYNLRFPQRFLNNVFQGKVKGAGIEVGRFLLNTTVGYAGFLDLAKEIDLVTPDEDFGQTLGFYGMKPGPYLVLPFLQPFTVRDFAGYVTDIFLNPINWLVAPIIEVEGIPSSDRPQKPHDDDPSADRRTRRRDRERAVEESREIPGGRRSDARSLHGRTKRLFTITDESDSRLAGYRSHP